MDFQRIQFESILDNNNLPSQDNRAFFSMQEKAIWKVYNLINWVHANPSKKSIKEETENVFVNSSQRKMFFDKLKNLISQTDCHLIFIRGKRGSGKTYLQNYFLNVEMPDINQTTWFRVDVTKIYTYNVKHAKSIDFQQYLWGQITFVFFRYSQSLRNYGTDKYFEEIKNSFNAIFDGTEMQKDEEKRDKFIRNIRDTEHRSDGLKGKPFKDNEIEIIAKNILRLLREKIQVVLFIDGIDNVNTVSRDFNKLKREVSDFMKNQLKDDLKIVDKVIYAARVELDTHKELLKELDNMQGMVANVYSNIDVPSIEINKLFEKINEISKQQEITIPKNFLKDIEIIQDQIEYYFQSKYDIKEISYLKSIFDGDIREAFFILLRIYFFIKRFMTTNAAGFSSIKDFNDKKNKQASAVFIEALFKNGCLYTADARDISFNQPVRGLGFTNIFNPNFYYETNNSPLLALQGMTLLYKQNYSIEDFVKKIRNNIENGKQAKEMLYKLAELNYIEIEEGIIHITQKGKLVYDETLSNVDVFGANIFNALRETKQSIGIRIHNPDGRGYQATILHNIPTYIAFLETISEEVDINFVDNIRQSYIELFYNSKLLEDTILDNLTEEAQTIFYDLVFWGSSNCVENMRKLKRIELYRLLNSFTIQDNMLFKETSDELKVDNVTLNTYGLKVLFILRVFNTYYQSKFLWSIEGAGRSFLDEIEDSMKLQSCLEMDKNIHSIEEIEKIIKPYLENLVYYVLITQKMQTIMKNFCENYLK